MSTRFRVVIPARYASTRLPGKPLRLIHDKPMIQWVYEAASRSEASEVIVATDHQRIFDQVEKFGGQVCMTNGQHKTGSDRILEVAQIEQWQDDDIVVNLQGDEPLMPSINLNQVAENLSTSDCAMSTLHKKIDWDQALNPNQVKLVCDHRGYAMYFSRSPIPMDKENAGKPYFGHIGLYAYRVGFLACFSQLPVCDLENREKLEQLRALWHGYKIHTELAKASPGPGIDTEADLEQIIQLLNKS